jgi:hypothetical protein
VRSKAFPPYPLEESEALGKTMYLMKGEVEQPIASKPVEGSKGSKHF